jgi:lipopolysaccharide transport system permease protein/teichoic acid transport system permease protein
MKLFKSAFYFIRSLWQLRRTIWEQARRDLISQQSGTVLGVFWNYAQPLTYAAVLTLVFSIGLRQNPSGKVSFLPYLISGMIAWHFYSAAISGMSGIIKNYSFLVRKGNFNLAILPLSKLLSFIIPHLAVIAAAVGICWMKGYAPSLYSFQVIYYLAAMLCLLLGLGWITSATSLFVEDIRNVVGVVIMFGFWFTPIVWNIQTVSPPYRWIISINPACYLVNGYRDSLIFRVPFWQKPWETLYFWLLTLGILLLGAIVFRRLKPHFGEVI